MFSIEKKINGALGRAGVLETAHGVIHTPAFVPVGTKATVKALTPVQLKEIGVEGVLGNTYHLYLEPGTEVVKKSGGLGKFMGWPGPTMTDSGGFQVFSLGAAFERAVGKVKKGSIVPEHSSVIPVEAGIPKKQALDPRVRGDDTRKEKLVSIDEDGVTFTSPKDGSLHRFTPEKSIEIQHDLGADIIFAFDECTSPEAPYEYQREAMKRTHRWAVRSLAEHKRTRGLTQTVRGQAQRTPPSIPPLERGEGKGGEPALFGIVQGGRFEDLRKESARTIGNMDFNGFGIGGSFDKEDMSSAVRWVNELLPEEKPRHLLGIGNPLDMFEAVENGCDLFDCVVPTREARNGSLYTRKGRVNITNAKYKTAFAPIDSDCGCYTCTHFTAAYVSHLFRSKEILANTLATLHNLSFIMHLLKNMRLAILDREFARYKEKFMSRYASR